MASLYCAGQSYSAVSVVYNLRIAETTKRAAQDLFNKPSTPVLTLFEQWRKKGPDTHEFIGGGLASYIALLNPFYIRIDFAAAHVSEKTSTVARFSRTQSDDLLLSGGYNYSLSKITRFTFSGLLGIPTHKDGILQGIQLGYGHGGLGGQVDGSFTFAHHTNHSIRSAVRYVRFFSRPITDCVEGQPQHYAFNVGNLMDVLVACHNKIGNSRLECGYNPTFLFGAKISPFHDSSFIKANSFIRNSFYGNYKYRFLIRTISNAVQASASYGFDVRPKVIGRSHIINIWGSWIVNF